MCVLRRWRSIAQDVEAVVAALPAADDEDRPVFAAFPEHVRRLRLLLDVDGDFAELCADFDAVAHAYQRGTHDDPALSSAADEYHSLRIELEGEILAWLRQGSRPVEQR